MHTRRRGSWSTSRVPSWPRVTWRRPLHAPNSVPRPWTPYTTTPRPPTSRSAWLFRTPCSTPARCRSSCRARSAPAPSRSHRSGTCRSSSARKHDYSVYGRNESPASETSLVVMGADVVGTITYEGEVLRGASARRRAHRSVSPGHQPVAGRLRVRSRTGQALSRHCCAISATEPRIGHPIRESARHRLIPRPTNRTHRPPARTDGDDVIDLLVAYTARRPVARQATSTG